LLYNKVKTNSKEPNTKNNIYKNVERLREIGIEGVNRSQRYYAAIFEPISLPPTETVPAPLFVPAKKIITKVLEYQKKHLPCCVVEAMLA